MNYTLDDAEVLILGGTGSLGRRLCMRILSGEEGSPKSVTIFSRDEAKQHFLRLELAHIETSTDDLIYKKLFEKLVFKIADVRNYFDVKKAVDRADIIFHAAALKQVPSCEYATRAATDTNIYGSHNICQAVSEGTRSEKHIIGISTDKACKPVNVMGMTKAIQERIFIQANIDSPWARFCNVRYGNVMASRGSVIPFFLDLARHKKPLTITDERMTRYLMTLDQSVDLIFNCYKYANKGETFIPIVPSANIIDIAKAVTENDDYPMLNTGIRPGEKLHEILVSEEEISRTEMRKTNLAILPILPELRIMQLKSELKLPFENEYSSSQNLLNLQQTKDLLKTHKLTLSLAPKGQEIYT